MNCYLTEILHNFTDRIINLEQQFEVFIPNVDDDNSKPNTDPQVVWIKDDGTGNKQRYKIFPQNNKEIRYAHIPVTERPASAKSNIQTIPSEVQHESQPIKQRPSSARVSTEKKPALPPLELPTRRPVTPRGRSRPVIMHNPQAQRLLRRQ